MRHRCAFKAFCLASILLLALFSAGCAQVSVEDRTPAPTAGPAAALSGLAISEKSDIAILAVDFNPPLNSKVLSSGQEAALYVAVENKGFRKESSVRVVVQLLGGEPGDLIRQSAQEIATLAPGEIKVLHFSSLLPVPYRPGYRLEIRIDPLAGEANLANNYKSYDIRVTGKW